MTRPFTNVFTNVFTTFIYSVSIVLRGDNFNCNTIRSPRTMPHFDIKKSKIKLEARTCANDSNYCSNIQNDSSVAFLRYRSGICAFFFTNSYSKRNCHKKNHRTVRIDHHFPSQFGAFSRLTSHASRLKHRIRIKDQGLRIKDQGSRIKD